MEFLLTRYGRRVSPDSLRATLARGASAAGIDPVTPHQLRHTYATALINAGFSLQAARTWGLQGAPTQRRGGARVLALQPDPAGVAGASSSPAGVSGARAWTLPSS